MLKENALYNAMTDLIMFMPHGYDKKRVKPTRIVGGAGPFDFSGVTTPAAIPFKLKADNGSVISGNVDLDDVGITLSAVTADQLVTALSDGLTAAGATGWTATKETTTGFVKLACSTSGVKYAQAWGEALEIALFGQGLGARFRMSNDIESFNPSPTMKEDTTLTATNAKGEDVEVIIAGYKKGFSGAIVDLPEDYEMMELMEGGIIDSAGAYHEPTVEQSKNKKSFEIYVLRRNYPKGTNKDSDLDSFELVQFYSCKGSVGGENYGASIDKKTYNIVGTNYTDETGAEFGYGKRTPLTIAQHDALPLEELFEAA
jgi:hypothetical protein